MVGLHAMTLWRWARAWRRAVTSGKVDGHRPLHGHPDWAVIIPARNEANRLTALLDDLKAQDVEGALDIWIVDDHSEDDTVLVAQQHPLAQTGHLKVICNDGAGKKSAILMGMTRAKSSWVVTLDADVRLSRTWASTWALALHQASSQTAAIAGPVILAAEPQNLGLWDGVQALDFAAQMGWSAGCLATRKPGSASGANLAVRRDVYPDTRHLGASGDDTLVIQALQQEGWEVDWLSDPRAVVKTEGTASVSSWIAQRLRWAGKTKHYAWRAQRTAWWMGMMAIAQWVLLGAAFLLPNGAMWKVALTWWMGVTALNVWFVRPVADWFGLNAKATHWVVLGLTQPLQAPLLLMARLGLLKFVGIPSRAMWKGRTCTS